MASSTKIGIKARRRDVRVFVSFLIALGLALPANAQIARWEREEGELSLGGYVRNFVATQNSEVRGFDTPTAGVGASVLRAEWQLAGEGVTIDFHQRVFLSLSTAAGLGGAGAGGLGVGVSTRPGRTFDMKWLMVDDPGTRVEHDIDRLVLRTYLLGIDFSLGRQAITWGTSNLFPVADLWTTFSPFELDTSQKRGIDGLRAIYGISDWGELDVVVADRGEWSDTSAGARLVLYLPFGDVWLGGAKMWELGMAMGGVSTEWKSLKFRGEINQPFELRENPFHLPRATLGVDFFAGNLVVGVEAHHNGTGVVPERNDNNKSVEEPEPSDVPLPELDDEIPIDNYLTQLSRAESLARGESYLLGRYYAGAFASYTVTEPITVSGSLLANLYDPSAMVALSLGYAPTQAVQLSFGFFQGLGALPRVFPKAEIQSEFGTYGSQVYVELAAFY
jgi:hypothetical protein